MCIFAVLLVNKYLSSSEMELILINIKPNNNYYYAIETSFIHIYDTTERLKSTRLAKQALYIKSYNNLTNGCEGLKLLTFFL